MRVLIIENHVLIREFLHLVLTRASDIDVVKNGHEVLRPAREGAPDVVIIGMSIGCEKGLRAMQQIRRRRAGAGIVVVSASFDEDLIALALQIGARGYVAERDVNAELVPAVRAVHQGIYYFSASVSNFVPQAAGSKLPALPELSSV